MNSFLWRINITHIARWIIQVPFSYVFLISFALQTYSYIFSGGFDKITSNYTQNLMNIAARVTVILPET